MKVSYDKETDSLTITLRDDRIKESDEIRPGVIADFGYDGGVVRFEIMQASKVVGNTERCSSSSTNELRVLGVCIATLPSDCSGSHSDASSCQP